MLLLLLLLLLLAAVSCCYLCVVDVSWPGCVPESVLIPPRNNRKEEKIIRKNNQTETETRPPTYNYVLSLLGPSGTALT